MVVTDNKEIASKIYQLRSFGHNELSYNYRMTEIAGALGHTRLQRLDEENDLRRQNAAYMNEVLKGISGISLRKPIPGATGVYYRQLLEYDPTQFNVSLDVFIELLQKEGIPFNKTFSLLHRHPHFNPTSTPARGCPWMWRLYGSSQFRQINYKDLSFPVAEEYVDNRIFELDIHSLVGRRDLEQTAEAIEKVICKGKIRNDLS